MKRILFLIFFSLVYTAYPILALGDEIKIPEAEVCQEKEGRIVVELNERLVANDPEKRAILGPIAVDIPQGKYNINAASFDDNSEEPEHFQTERSWFMILKNADEEVVVETSPTTPLPNDLNLKEEVVEENFQIDEEIKFLTARHAAFPTEEHKSIRPVCASFDLIKEEKENLLPIWDAPLKASTTLGTLLEFKAEVQDPDGDELKITASLPAGASYDKETGTFSWIPLDTGTSTTVFSAFDGTGTSTHETILEVFKAEDKNNLPVWTGPNNASTKIGKLLEFGLTVADPDGDNLVITTLLPPGATYATSTGLFSWLPLATSTLGTTTAKFFAFDGTGTSTHEVLIEVLKEDAANRLPVWEGPQSASTTLGILLEFEAKATDPDGDALVITTLLPPGATYATSTRTFSWLPVGTSTIGTTTANFFAFDGTGTSTLTVLLEVLGNPDGNNLPVFSGPTTASTTLGGTLELNVSVLDPDGDNLVITTLLPPGATYATSTGLFSWLPLATSTLGTTTAKFFAFDGTGTSTHEVLIEVLEAPKNLGPFFVNFNPPTVATSTEPYEYDVEASDPENDPLEFSLLKNPEGMTIATSTGLITWTPTAGQASSTLYLVELGVSDGLHTASTSYQILVVLPEDPEEEPEPKPQPPTSGGGGGGGGGITLAANGPPLPIGLPVIPGPIPTPSTVTGNISAPINNSAPLQPVGGLIATIGGAPNELNAEENIFEGISIEPPKTDIEAPATGFGRFTALLFVGLLNILDWLKENCCLLLFLLWILTVIAFLAYIYYTRRRDQNGNPGKENVIPLGSPEIETNEEDLFQKKEDTGIWKAYLQE